MEFLQDPASAFGDRAERHPEPAHQALAGTSSQGATYDSDNLIGLLGLSCVRGANIEGTFGKDSPLATGIAATPATDMHITGVPWIGRSCRERQ